jgi:hypothetical protein
MPGLFSLLTCILTVEPVASVLIDLASFVELLD